MGLSRTGLAAAALVFEPALPRTAPGGTVRLLAAGQGHGAETPAVPERTPRFRGRGSEASAVTSGAPGLHGCRGTPRHGPGMVGLIATGGGREAEGSRDRAREGFGRMSGEVGG